MWAPVCLSAAPQSGMPASSLAALKIVPAPPPSGRGPEHSKYGGLAGLHGNHGAQRGTAYCSCKTLSCLTVDASAHGHAWCTFRRDGCDAQARSSKRGGFSNEGVCENAWHGMAWLTTRPGRPSAVQSLLRSGRRPRVGRRRRCAPTGSACSVQSECR